SPPVSPAIPSPVATPSSATTLNEDDLLEIGAQLKLDGSILHIHIEHLDALPPTLFEGYGQDFTELFSRSKVVREEIYSHRFRLRSLERVQEETGITISTIWRTILALKTWQAVDQREMQELKDRIAALEQRRHS
ncbi:hypothetical protein Tco_1487763, partial [Tanacetum coccineum]